MDKQTFMSYANDPLIGYLFDNPESPFGDRGGIECDSGWFDIVLVGLKCIALNDPDQVVRISQIKEKFGSMRFYLGFKNTDPESEKARRYASSSASAVVFAAYGICETCGAKKTLNLSNLNFNPCGCGKDPSRHF